jgi:hypothetical protein
MTIISLNLDPLKLGSSRHTIHHLCDWLPGQLMHGARGSGLP